METIRLAVLGAGGLGKVAVEIVSFKKAVKIVAICDNKGFAFSEDGITPELMSSCEGKSVGEMPGIGRISDDSIGDVCKMKSEFDGIFIALPNFPNDFIPSVVERICESGFEGAIVDVIKRSSAMKKVFELEEMVKKSKSTYITGAGATPGILSAAAVIASQSFISVDDVSINWGVGISNWEKYKATVREDIAHLPGFSLEKAQKMTDSEVEEFLDENKGKIELTGMEHADDILLERANVIEKEEQCQVGGIIDTRNAKKPVSTTMTLRGRTYDGKVSSHKFVLGDETSMGANVVGPALGYLKKAEWLRAHNAYGIFGSTEVMPQVLS